MCVAKTRTVDVRVRARANNSVWCERCLSVYVGVYAVWELAHAPLVHSVAH